MYNFTKECISYLNDIHKSINIFINMQDNNMLKSYMVENYISNSLVNDYMLVTKNWWIMTLLQNGKNKDFIFHFCKNIDEIDKHFEEKLIYSNYEVVHIVLSCFEGRLYCVYQGNEYLLEELIKKLRLVEQKSLNNKFKNNNYSEKRDETTKIILPTIIEYLDPYIFVVEHYIVNNFFPKYFHYITNLDVVWYNIYSKNFHIGEIKAKTKNEAKEFYMNFGEKISYTKILKSGHIKVDFLCLLTDKKTRDIIYLNIINGIKNPIFALSVDYDYLNKLEANKIGYLSEFSKSKGIKQQKMISIPYNEFSIIDNLRYLGEKDTSTYQQRINNALYDYSHYFDHIKVEQRKRFFMLFATLYKLREMGFSFDFDCLVKNLSEDFIVTINDKKIYFKFFEKKNGWTIRLDKSLYEYCIEQKIDYIIVFKNILDGEYNIDLINDNIYTYNVNSLEKNKECVEILGFLSWKDFQEKHKILPSGCYDNQTNIHKIIKGEEPISEKGNLLKEDLHFLQILGFGNCEQYIQYKLQSFIKGENNELFNSLYE